MTEISALSQCCYAAEGPEDPERILAGESLTVDMLLTQRDRHRPWPRGPSLLLPQPSFFEMACRPDCGNPATPQAVDQKKNRDTVP